MATYIKRGDSWKAEIFRKGIRRSKTFLRKQEAIAWAGQQEAEIMAGDRGHIPEKSFSDLLDRYAKSVSPGKKGERWEQIRIEALKRDRIAHVRLKQLSATHAADWRDRRLTEVSAASVAREKNILSHVCEVAVREWKWLKSNPFFKLRMPRKPEPRSRVIADEERTKLENLAQTEIQKEVIRCMAFALETGMRAGEILKLSEVRGKVAILPDTKNGTRREVPLSDEALRIWEQGKFWLSSAQLDVHWRKMTKAAGIKDLHFHDTRGTCATRLSKILNPLQLARMLGHKDLKMIMVYYRETAEDIAEKLG
jgi:integrase